MNYSDLPPSFPSGLLGTLGSVVIKESKKIANAKSKRKVYKAATKITDIQDKKGKVEKRSWTLEERAAMLDGLEKHAFGNWASMSYLVTSR